MAFVLIHQVVCIDYIHDNLSGSRHLQLVYFRCIFVLETENTIFRKRTRRGGSVHPGTLSGKNMIQIGYVVSEICRVKVKSREARLFKQVRLFGEIRYAEL